MHSHVAHEVQPEPTLGLFLGASARAAGGLWRLSRAQRLCERAEYLEMSGGRGVGCKSEQHLLPGLWRLV